MTRHVDILALALLLLGILATHGIRQPARTVRVKRPPIIVRMRPPNGPKTARAQVDKLTFIRADLDE